MMLSPRFTEALAFAAELHRDQVRKGTTIPYVSHLLATASIVLEHGGGEDEAIAALLHDAVEDQGGLPTLERIRARFGEAVAGIVHECTDAETMPKPPWHHRKEAYIAAIPHKSAGARLVSCADKLHNARAILADLRQHGPALWERFTGGAHSLWYYRALADAFAVAGPQRLAAELERVVAEIEAEAARIA
jgi:(p)ppGpp synthase/HD superfamily hydrolase